MEKQPNIEPIETLPFFGINQNNLLPFQDWVTVRSSTIQFGTDTEKFCLTWHKLFVATQQMSEEGFTELCYWLNRPHKVNGISLPARSFIELWTIARGDSMEVQALKAAGMIEEEEEGEQE